MTSGEGSEIEAGFIDLEVMGLELVGFSVTLHEALAPSGVSADAPNVKRKRVEADSGERQIASGGPPKKKKMD